MQDNSKSERVILVDEKDRELGTEEKMKAHEQGLLHRAISVFIFDKEGRLLLQQRAADKYHSAGLWTNACCSHPRPGESAELAAHRRLKEEMGFDCELQKIFAFTYYVSFPNGLSEHELDHVFTGTCQEDPTPDAREVQSWKWVHPKDLQKDMDAHPGHYTYWFKEIAGKVIEGYAENKTPGASKP